MKAVGLVVLACLAAGSPWRQQEVFRAATHAVAVDVAVFDGNRAVASLGPADFEVADNGVVQTITGVDSNVLPIDLRLVFDTSGSITQVDLDRYHRAMSMVAAALRPDDRCEIVTFSGRIADAARRQHPPITITLRRTTPDGTSFYDAVSLAMITLPALDRRQVTIVLSDAEDNSSFFDEATMLGAARRSDAVVYTILPVAVTAASPFAGRLHALSLLTGGRLVRAQRDSHMGNTIIEALQEFRQSYVVRYTLTGVPLEGWHRLSVKVRGRHSYAVRARSGYFGR